MIVDLTDDAGWPKEFDLTIEPAEMDFDSNDVSLTGYVSARGTVEKHAGWFEIHGFVKGSAVIDCSRCLEPVARQLSIPFNIRFVRPNNGGEANEREVDSENLDLSELESDDIDLTEVIREQILLDLPEQVYCKEDCKGLCQKCGANRNLRDCKCENEAVDPRWAALKDLK